MEEICLKHYKLNFSHLLFVCVQVPMHAMLCVEVRGQFCGIDSLLPSYGYQRLNLGGGGAWWRVLLPAEASHWPKH